MCFVCEMAGDGRRWYLNPKNYGRQMYKVRKPGEGFSDFGTDPESQGGNLTRKLIEAFNDDPEEAPDLIRQHNEFRKRYGASQVITLQEAQEVAELSYPVASMSCICRIHTRAREERNEHEYSCTGLGVGMLKWERWPERYKGGIHFMNPDEAKAWLEKWNKRGMVHVIMTFGGTYVGGICNCDYPDCGAIRNRVDYGIGMLKGHYIAKVNYDVCNGCGVCVQRCQFGAIKFEVTTDLTNIDEYKCFGCGLCQTGCPRGAIEMVERASFPALREVW